MCQICIHPQREAIDRAIVAGDSLRKIGTMFGTSKSEVDRHKNVCMKRALTPVSRPAPIPAYQSAEQVAVTELVSTSIITRVSALVNTLEQQATECATDKDRRNMTATATALLKALELNARLTGELTTTGNQTAIAVNVGAPSLRSAPEWPVLLSVLDRHPEIKIELLDGLKEAGL